ncbi:MAG: alginate export family protein [Salinivirgaceae bacterium]|jgi:hypothetical protein|nr:alginate export family protein [Salinivirgaceae bacterium]
MIQLKTILSSAMFLFALAATAQDDKLQISAELRPRIIVDGGYAAPKAKEDETPVYTTQRTRLNALFASEKFESYVSLQDVRLWGADNNYKSSGVYGNTESLSLNQAWTKFEFKKDLSIKIGRQLFAYDDQRVISSRNWNDYQVTYDALLFEYKKEKHLFNLGLTYNAQSKNDMFYPEQKFKTFDFLYYKHQLDKLSFSGIAIITGNTISDTTQQVYYRGTYGANIIYKHQLSNIRTSLYYQHNLTEIGERTSAYCFSLFGEYEFLKHLNIGLGIDYLSGNDETSEEITNTQFDLLYGRRHSWYGYMDYFSTTPEQGLQDCMLKIRYNFFQKMSLNIDWHYFLLSADRYDVTNASALVSRQLGQEIDLKLNWDFYSGATFECGYSFYNLTETLKQVKNVNNENLRFPQFCYLMITIKPSAWINIKA